MTKENYNIPLEKGDQMELKVESLASSGDGIARHEGYTVFVPTTLPGDRVTGEITKTTPRFGVARVLEQLQGSPDRIEPACPVFMECGGCKLQHYDYKKQVEFKVQVVTDALQRIGKLEISKPIPALAADPIYHYRNKGSFALQKMKSPLKVGFFQEGTHEVADSTVCDLLIEPINSIKEWLRALLVKHKVSIYNETKHQGFLRGFLVRSSPVTGENLIGLITTRGIFSKFFLKELLDEDALKTRGVVGVVQNFNPKRTNVILGPKTKVLWGRDTLTDRLGDLTFQLSLESFFQVNPYQTVRLYDLIRDWVKEQPGPVLDAYCGNGGISLWLAKAGIEVTGIDPTAASIADAKKSAELNGIDRCRFLEGEFEQYLDDPDTLGLLITLIVDPPRKGCSESVIEAISKRGPERLIYVSCNPSTLARDLALLEGYSIEDIRVVDMFPQTAHVETAVKLKRITS